jgi:hypothetical protein
VVGYVRQADVPGTLPDDSVTFAKLQNIATARLLGRATAGTGDVEELTAIPSGVDVPAARLSGTIDVARLPGQATINLGTAVNSTSGTAIDFTGIPSWARRVTVMFNGVSTNGTSSIIAQLGDSGGFETTGYVGSAHNGANAAVSFTAGFPLTALSNAASSVGGLAFICTLGGNVWAGNAIMGASGANNAQYGGAVKTLSDTLDRIRITTVNGTDTFDAGSINISWE